MDPRLPQDPFKIDKLTLKNGQQVGDKLNSLLLGPKGPNLLADVAYLEETAHFNRERIPERVVHAKGAAAYGNFIVTNNEMAKYCKASMFSTLYKKTPVVVRFSHVTGESGYPDTVRDVRGFAVKFKTETGNWDLVGNNLPVFFIRDPINFTSFIHSQKRNPKTHLRDPDAFWDFVACKPETLHTIVMLFSDRGIPDGFRHMHGFGVNTFKLVNEKHEYFFAKFHWICEQKIRNLEPKKATATGGADPDYYFRDLMLNIQAGNHPAWMLKVQIIKPQQVDKIDFNIFDVTKTWPHAQFPLIDVGRMVLDHQADNYFAEVEQLAFSPANMIPGIEASQDKMLVGRMMSYGDAQRYRLNVNYPDIPVNQPRCPVMTPTYADGVTFMSNPNGSLPNYVPSLKYRNMKIYDDSATEHKQLFGVAHQGRFDLSFDDNYSQAKVFITKVLGEEARKRVAFNIGEHLSQVKSSTIKTTVINHFRLIDTEFCQLIENKLEHSTPPPNQQSKKIP